MIKIYTILFIGFLLAINLNTSAQCTPDPTCTDILLPGEICPEILPDGTVGVPYNQVVTIIPPTTATIGGVPLTIVQIKLKSVGNIPPGLTYQNNPSSGIFPSGIRSCTNIYGTPTTAGVYPLTITVTPYISVLGNPTPVTDQVDDTSLAITINPQTSSYSVINMNKFSVLEGTPNPFNYSSRIGCIVPGTAEIRLTVFDVVGNLIYKETKVATRGENYFDFDGVKLGKGMYIYTVTNGKESSTKQLIKN